MWMVYILSLIHIFTYAIGKFTNGFLADRSNINRFMTTGLLVTALVNLCLGFVHSFISVSYTHLGEPIIGASVLVKGTANGVITDLDGHYSLADVPGNAMLAFSYIGYQTVERCV